MSNSEDASSLVARALSSVWDELQPARVGAYLSSVYGFEPDASPTFADLHIAEAEWGDVQGGRIGGAVRKWWTVDQQGFREGYEEFDPDEEDGVFHMHPVRKFFVKGRAITIGERLGPDLLFRKVGKLSSETSGITIENLSVKWLRSPNPNFRMG